MKEDHGPVTQATTCCGADVAMADQLERSLGSNRRRSTKQAAPAEAEQEFDASGALVWSDCLDALAAMTSLPLLLPLSVQCACACRLVSWLS